MSKDNKTLYFSDEEIDTEANGEKKVFITKRINGKESHVKAEKQHKKNGKHSKEEIQKNIDAFNFNNEIVLGVNIPKDKDKKQKNKKKKSKSKKNNKTEKTNTTKHSNKKVIKIVTIILLIIVICIFAFTAPIFNITNIEVNGNNQINTEEIISLSKLKKGDNIFRFNNSIISNIKENSYVEKVKIKRMLPGTVVIHIEERNVAYQINLINSYTYIDKNGYILENSTTKKEVPVIVGLKITEDELLNKERLGEEDLKTLNEILKIIDAAKAIEKEKSITEINVKDRDDYVLYLENENKKVHIGDTSNLTNKMLYLQKILEGEQGKSGTAFINGDISAGFKPYFREE